jgi:hypothetical protein
MPIEIEVPTFNRQYKTIAIANSPGEAIRTLHTLEQADPASFPRIKKEEKND